MYQLTVEPFTYPVHRREADARLFREHGRTKTKGPLSVSDLALVSLALTSEAQKPVATAEQLVTRDAAPKIVDGASVFGWNVRERTADTLDAARSNEAAEQAPMIARN
jgi:hypothetical protein